MKKIFRLANAEFNKIFYRPSIFILTALLIITLVATNLLYSPTYSTKKLIYEDLESVNEIYKTFNGTNTKITTKMSIDSEIDERYKVIVTEYESIIKDDKLKTFQDKLSYLNQSLTVTLRDEYIKVNKYSNTEYKSKKAEAIAVLEKVKSGASDLLSYMSKIKLETLNFYMSYSQYDTIYKNVETLYKAFPNKFTDLTKDTYVEFGQSINEDYSLQPSLEILSKVQNEQIKIDEKQYIEIVTKYYINAKKELNDVYFAQITAYDLEHATSEEKEDLNKMNELVANYYSFAQMNIQVLENKFMLLRIADKTDIEIKDLIGYSEVSKYKLNEQNQIFDYLIDRHEFDYNYLRSFNFNIASGATSNVYDYTVYSMQILSILIIVFTAFYACSSIAGDQTSGTMKMIAIRPYTRNKLFSGKYLSCVMFGGLLMLVAFVASFVVGAVSFGVPFNNCLVVFNASTILTINPLLLLGIYFLSLLLNLLFYISLAMLICLIFKSNTLSLFLTVLAFIAQLVLNGVINNVWLKYTIFAHFDLFKYFGNSHFGFLGMNILPDSNFTTSALVLGSAIVLMNIVSHFIFKQKDIA